MAARKTKNYEKSRRMIGLRAVSLLNRNLSLNINGKVRNLVIDYIEFLTSLDIKEKFSKYAYKIIPKSAQWNAVRRKHVTASNVGRLCKWQMKSDYLLSKLSRYVSDTFESRGAIVEKQILDEISNNGYDIRYNNQIWIHRDIPWLSCTTDGVIVENDIVKIAIEIKSFTSLSQLKKEFNFSYGNLQIKDSSNTYAQIQTIAEVLNITHVLLVVEYEDKWYKFVIRRNLDFIWGVYDKLKEAYFRWIVPHNIYGLLNDCDKKTTNKRCYMNSNSYHRLMKILEMKEREFQPCGDWSFFMYYGNNVPSEINDTYFEMFEDKDLIVKLNNMNLKHV